MQHLLQMLQNEKGRPEGQPGGTVCIILMRAVISVRYQTL
jgi:hypothetical protein